MTLRNRRSLIIASSVLLTATAQAEERWYASADFAALSLDTQTLEYEAPGLSQLSETDFDTGFGAGATLGYQINSNWATELSVTYRSNEQEVTSIPALGTFTDGNFASLGVGLEALYGFDIDWIDGLRGYVGGGLAWFQEIDIDFEANGQETSFETDELGYSIRAGVRYPFANRWFADLGVQALFASDITMENGSDSTQTITSDYDPLAITLKVGYRF